MDVQFTIPLPQTPPRKAFQDALPQTPSLQILQPLQTPPPRRQFRQTTRDQRHEIQTLYTKAGWKFDEIEKELGVTRGQITYALKHRLTP
jgi:hypothetical protein